MSSDTNKRVLVVGASGLIGTAAVDEFASNGWEVATLSRRRPEFATVDNYQHFAVDLDDRSAVAELVAAELSDITHIVYTAV